MKKKFLLVIVFVAVIGVIIGTINNNRKPLEKIGYALDTQIRIVVYDKGIDNSIIENAYNEILKLDRILSNYNTSSEIFELNYKKSIKASPYLKEIVKTGCEITKKTDGAYDITIFPLSKLWDYKIKKVPDKEKITNAKSRVGIENIEINDDIITLKNQAEIDVSSIAKGYIADYIIDYLNKNGVKNALVDAGGNIKVTGNAGGNKEGFKIGIKDPSINIEASLGYLTIKDKSIVTSGIYERNFTVNNKFYHHIIDAKTGYPSESDVVSASIISKSSMEADAYATAIVVMGSEKGLKIVESIDGLECIIIKKGNTILVSGGIKDFVISNNNYKLGG